MKKGTFKVIRSDGKVEDYKSPPTLDIIHEKLGVDCIDTVILSYDKQGMASEVMLVDDTGMIDNKPVNEKATKMMIALFPGYVYSIHGDVAICNDNDFSKDI